MQAVGTLPHCSQQGSFQKLVLRTSASPEAEAGILSGYDISGNALDVTGIPPRTPPWGMGTALTTSFASSPVSSPRTDVGTFSRGQSRLTSQRSARERVYTCGPRVGVAAVRSPARAHLWAGAQRRIPGAASSRPKPFWGIPKAPLNFHPVGEPLCSSFLRGNRRFTAPRGP